MNDMVNVQTLAAFLAIVAAVAGLLKYVFYLLDKHKEHIDGRFKDHSKKIENNASDIRRQEERLTLTREEMHSEFVKHGQLNQKMEEHGQILSAMFKRINEMAKDLNQLIGAHNGKVKPDVE